MKRRFSAQESTVKRELMNTMNKIEATSLKIELDEMTGAVKVIFDRNGKRYIKACERWEISLDNLRAIGLSIEYLYRAIEIYGVDTKEEFNDLFETHFVGIEATPDNDVIMIENKSLWYEILGITPSPTRKAVNNAYRVLCKIYHPDVGGDAESFKRIKTAYEEAQNNIVEE